MEEVFKNAKTISGLTELYYIKITLQDVKEFLKNKNITNT